jgi:hypothetical protein
MLRFSREPRPAMPLHLSTLACFVRRSHAACVLWLRNRHQQQRDRRLRGGRSHRHERHRWRRTRGRGRSWWCRRQRRPLGGAGRVRGRRSDSRRGNAPSLRHLSDVSRGLLRQSRRGSRYCRLCLQLLLRHHFDGDAPVLLLLRRGRLRRVLQQLPTVVGAPRGSEAPTPRASCCASMSSTRPCRPGRSR